MPRSPLLPLALFLTGCPPWIPQETHALNMEEPARLLVTDLEGADTTCEGQPGATAWYLGEWILYDDHSLIGIDQIAYFVNDAWADEGGEDCWHGFDVEGTWFAPPDTVDLERTWSTEGSTCDPDGLLVPTEDTRSYLLYQDAEDDETFLLVNPETEALFTEAHVEEGLLRYVSGPYCVLRGDSPVPPDDAEVSEDRRLR